MELPNDINTERMVLGTLIRYNELMDKVGDMLSARTFYDIRLSGIYRCVADLIAEGKVTDINAIAGAAKDRHMDIERGDIVEVVACCNESTFMQGVRRLHRMDMQRTLWQTWIAAAGRIVEPLADVDEELENVAQAVADIRSSTSDEGVASFAESFMELDRLINDNKEGRHSYLRTGFQLFDRHYILRPSTLTILAAFTSVGKSALALNIAVAVAKQGAPVAYYSLEMGKTELAARAVSKPAELTAGRIMNANLDAGERTAYAEASAELAALPIYIDERSTSSFDRTLRSIRTLHKTKGVQLVVIDYLQIYAQNGDRVEEGLAAMARAAKNVAKECGIAVLLLSQLNRSADHPSIRMLRGSGQIEESADNVVLIDRPSAYPDGGKYQGEHAGEETRDTALLILAKGRGVGTGDELVGFDGAHTTFYELNRLQSPDFGKVPWKEKQENNLTF